MNTIKSTYAPPTIECIELDNEISLVLESNPPLGPDETFNSVQNPFKGDSVLV